VAEAQARFAIAARSSAVAVGLGPAYLYWVGPVAFTARAAPLFGVQYFDKTVFLSAGAHSGLGVGMTLAQSEHAGPSWHIWEVGEGKSESVVRKRTLLTLELSGAADTQVRGATFSAGILVGIAWSEEQWQRERLTQRPWGLQRGEHPFVLGD
jgi:hypothetical protein